MNEDKQTIAVGIPKALHDAVVELCNIRSTPAEFICQAIVDKLKKDILIFDSALGFAKRDLNVYEGKK